MPPDQAAVGPGNGHFLPGADGAVIYPADGLAADISVIINEVDSYLQGCLRVPAGGRYMLHDYVKQGLQVFPGLVRVQAGRSLAGYCVDHREIQLLLGGAQVDEKVQDFVDHRPRPGVGPVHFIDDHDRFQTHR
ncbi:hypothetical protein MOOR_28410 [Moorella thermoacetica]|uniref:Uncharacterized protein n=1 Tax=Neomoorella thermoacetica TaxID=1525 RepID=A0A1J5JFF7_NEOTH|nr:hypothetical protein MOOR_28410 [Moorella thermoacetica]